MKITLLQDYLRCGSTEKQCIYLADYFKRHGQNVTLLTFRPGGLLAADVNARGIKHISLQPFDTNMDWLAPGLIHEIAEENPDIVLCMGRMANGYAGRIRKHFPNIIVIGTARTGRPLTKANIEAFGKVHAIVANSEWWREELLNYGIDENRIFVVHNKLVVDFNEKEYDKERQKLRKKMGANDHTCVFLNIATMRRMKHHTEIIQALSKLDKKADWQLWLVGDGAGFAWVKFAVERLNLQDRVFFLGHQDDIFPFLAASDIAISASTQDSQQRFIVEAQSIGLPAIAYNHGGTKECFIPNITGLLIGERDRNGLTEAAKILVQDSKLRKKMGKAAAEYARREFSGDHQGDSFLKLIQDIWAENMARKVVKQASEALHLAT